MPAGWPAPILSAISWSPRGVPSESATLEGGRLEVDITYDLATFPLRRNCRVDVPIRTTSTRSACLMPRAERVLLNDSQDESMDKTSSFTVGIVGATGAVGQELLRLLEERKFPVSTLRLFASARSAGKTVRFGGRDVAVEEARPGVFANVDVAFFAAGGAVTRALAPDAVKAGCLVIDKSSALRLDPDVPLVIPEINPEALRRHKGIIANPNCSTAVTLMGALAAAPAVRPQALRHRPPTSPSPGLGPRACSELEAQVQAHAKGTAMAAQGLPAPDRLQRHTPGRFLRAERLHGRGDQDHAREPQDHGAAASFPSRRPASGCRSSAPIRSRSTPSSSAR